MKICLLSEYGDSMDILFRISLDGNRVMGFINNPLYKENFTGIVPMAKTWQEAVKNSDIVIFDDNKLTHIWRAIHKQYLCFGGSEFGARLEEDRKFGHEIMKRAGIPPIESISFKTLREVIPHLKSHDVPHVVKVSGDHVESHHIIVGEDKDNKDAIDQVERLIDLKLPIDSVEVEERKLGVECGLSFLFNGTEVCGPVEWNAEFKRSNERETGYLTQEMGTVLKYLDDHDIPFYNETLKKVIPILQAANYKGEIDLNCIANEEGFFPLEWTPRLGKPSVFIQDELRVTPWGEVFHSIASGQKTDIRVRSDWALGVVYVAFGFPFEDEANKISKGLVVKGLNENNLEHLHPWQMRLDKKGRFVYGSGNGLLLTATGRGHEIDHAKRRAYESLAQVKCPNAWNRWDIGDKISPYELDELGILPREESVISPP